MDRFPMLSMRLGAAWQVVLRELQDGDWHDQRPIIRMMMAAGDIVPKTCTNLIWEGVHCGFLQRKWVYNGRGYTIRHRKMQIIRFSDTLFWEEQRREHGL
jgi:hypothetical protein